MIAEKQLLLDEIVNQINKSSAMVIASYKKLGSNVSWGLSCELAKSNASFEVVKKRILIKALEQTALKCTIDELESHIGVVFINGADYIEAIKGLVKFSKSNNDLLKIIKGQFEGISYSAQDVEMLSNLPGKDEMRAQLLSLLEAPLSQTLSVMENVLTSVPFCLQNKLEKE